MGGNRLESCSPRRRVQRNEKNLAHNATNLTVIKSKRTKNSILKQIAIKTEREREIEQTDKKESRRTYLRNCRQQTKRNERTMLAGKAQ